MLYRSSARYVGVALSSLRVVVTVSPKFELKEVGRRIPWIKISTEVYHAMSKLLHITVAKLNVEPHFSIVNHFWGAGMTQW